MSTITKIARDAKFFSSLSNARRALRKVYACDTETANGFIHQADPETDGRFWYSEAAVNAAANPQVEADKATVVEIAAPAAPSVSKSRSVVQNGVRKPIKGLCADVWLALSDLHDAGKEVNISVVRELCAIHNWNVNNATIEFYGWRKFHGLNAKAVK